MGIRNKEGQGEAPKDPLTRRGDDEGLEEKEKE